MTKPIVYVDVDGVCADLLSTWLDYYNLDWNDQLTCDDILSWDLTPYVKPECGKTIYSYLQLDYLYHQVQPIPGALEGVQQLRAMGYDVLFLTSSNDETAGQKMRWLAKHGFVTDTVHWSEVIIAHRKDVFTGYALIDDGAHNIEAAPHIERPILFDAPHNRGSLVIDRARSWEQVVQMLDPKPFVGLEQPALSGSYIIGEHLDD